VRAILVWWIACLLWSSTFLFIRIGLAEIPPFTFAWIRLGIALSVLVPMAAARGDLRMLTAREIVRVAAAGILLLGLNYALVFWGAQFIPSGLVAILLSATPLIGLAFGWLLGRERVTVRKVVAVAMAIVGVTVIFGAEAFTSGPAAIRGAVAVLAAATCVAAAYVWMKGYVTRVAPLTVTTVQAVAAVVPLVSVALLAEGRPAPSQWSASAWGALAYLGLVASVVAFGLNYWLLERMDASAMLMMGVAEVPIAIALGSVLLGERLPAGTLMGTAFVLAGVTAALAPQFVTVRLPFK